MTRSHSQTVRWFLSKRVVAFPASYPKPIDRTIRCQSVVAAGAKAPCRIRGWGTREAGARGAAPPRSGCGRPIVRWDYSLWRRHPILEPTDLPKHLSEAGENVRTRRVLFIDDDDSVRSNASRLFTEMGYRTFTAATGREGIKVFNVLEELRPKQPMCPRESE